MLVHLSGRLNVLGFGLAFWLRSAPYVGDFGNPSDHEMHKILYTHVYVCLYIMNESYYSSHAVKNKIIFQMVLHLIIHEHISNLINIIGL